MAGGADDEIPGPEARTSRKIAVESAPERVDAAAAALTRARVAAGRRPRVRRRRQTPVTFSGPRPDGRDPQRLGRAVDEWVRGNGYSDELTVSGLLTRWREVVGPQIADHVSVGEYRSDADGGTVVLHVDSAGWELQLRYMRDDLLQKITDEIGAGLVTRLDIRGPAVQRVGRGRLRVRTGRRSPRD